MGRLLALGIPGTLASQKIRVPAVRTVRTVPMGGILVAMLLASSASAQTGSLTGTITTTAKGVAPVRVTIDQKVCGNELPDEAIIVDAQGRLANAVVLLSGVKRSPPAEATVMNEKCRFAPRVQLMAPKASIKTTSK